MIILSIIVIGLLILLINISILEEPICSREERVYYHNYDKKDICIDCGITKQQLISLNHMKYGTRILD